MSDSSNTQEIAITAEVRTKRGKILKTENGNPVPNIRMGSFQYYNDESAEENGELIKANLTSVHTELSTLMPNLVINLEARIYDNISQTWSGYAAYYGKEKRFVLFS